MNHAFVKNNDVKWTIETDNPSAHFGPGVIADLKPCPAEVEKGWHFDGTNWTPPTAAEEAAKEAADERAALRDAASDRLDKLIDVLEAKGDLTVEEIDEIMAAGRE